MYFIFYVFTAQRSLADNICEVDETLTVINRDAPDIRWRRKHLRENKTTNVSSRQSFFTSRWRCPQTAPFRAQSQSLNSELHTINISAIKI